MQISWGGWPIKAVLADKERRPTVTVAEGPGFPPEMAQHASHWLTGFFHRRANRVCCPHMQRPSCALLVNCA